MFTLPSILLLLQLSRCTDAGQERQGCLIVEKQLGLDLSLNKTLQILSVPIFGKNPDIKRGGNFRDELCIQLSLFDLR